MFKRFLLEKKDTVFSYLSFQTTLCYSIEPVCIRTRPYDRHVNIEKLLSGRFRARVCAIKNIWSHKIGVHVVLNHKMHI